MTNADMLKGLVEAVHDVAKIKGENQTLRNENAFLRDVVVKQLATPYNKHNDQFDKKLEDSVVKARTKHGAMEEVAHVVNNRHREAGLGDSPLQTDGPRNNDERLPIKADTRDSEGNSATINTEADVLLTIRDNLDYANQKGNRTSLRLDTSGQVVAWLGADIDDYRSLSMELDGGIQAAVGKTKTEGKSLNGLFKGGLKLIVGMDNENVEHNTDEGLKGYPSEGERAYTTNQANTTGTGQAKGGKKYEKVGYHPHIDYATQDKAGAINYIPWDDTWATDKKAIQHVDLEGTSINLKTLGSTWFTLGQNKDQESMVVDTAGSVVSQIGVDKFDRSLILHADGSVNAYVGKSKEHGNSLHIQTAGGTEIVLREDDNGDSLLLTASGNVKVAIGNQANPAPVVHVSVHADEYYEEIFSKGDVKQYISAPKVVMQTTGEYHVFAKSFTTHTGEWETDPESARVHQF
jgi:hypothetical protein